MPPRGRSRPVGRCRARTLSTLALAGTPDGQEVLRAEALALPADDPADRLTGATLSLHAGEILGVAGVEGRPLGP